MRDRINAYRILVGKPEGIPHFGDINIDGKTILSWILSKWAVRMRTKYTLLLISS
jgi:hypothetical protein